MPTPPSLTPEQRRAASERAVAARRFRAAVRTELTSGTLTLGQALVAAQADGERARALGATKVRVLLQALPGIGPRRADQIMTELAIPPDRRVRGLGPSQRQGLLERCADRRGLA